MRHLTIFFLGTLLCAAACRSESDASDVVILVNSSVSEASAGEKVYFDISVRTLHERIVDFTVGTSDPIGGDTTLFSDNPDTRVYEMRFLYEPQSYPADSVPVELYFSAMDNLNFRRTLKYKLCVLGDNALLPEKSGFTIWAPESGRPDGFSLARCQPLLCEASDSTEIDIFQYAAAADSEELSREWRTMTDIRFAKADNFDYAAATRGNVASAYASSVRLNYVAELDNDDVILIGRGAQAWGVMKIVAVFDEAGTSDDRYLFNLKSMR